MTVRVKLYAAARERAGQNEVDVSLPVGATVADVRAALLTAVPALADVLPHSHLAVDAEYADEGTIVSEAAELALIPPVSGG